MDCEEIREHLDAAPSEDFAGRRAHLAECEACQTYAKDADAFEQKLGAAMRVPVPTIAMPDLSAEVVSIVSKRPPKIGRSSALWLAAAASVMLAVLVGVRLIAPVDTGYEDGQLVAELLEHMSHEPYSLVVTSDAVPLQQVSSVTQSVNAEVSPQLGLISYARSCEVNGRSIPHLVVQGKTGPVTIMIMPDQTVADAIAIEDADFHGVVVPVGESGSVAIIGRKGESIEDIRAKIDDAIRLSI